MAQMEADSCRTSCVPQAWVSRLASLHYLHCQLPIYLCIKLITCTLNKPIMILNDSSFHSMKQDHIRSSYVGIVDMQEGFQSERTETSHSASEHDQDHHNLDKEFHIKYPVQAVLAHFKSIFTERGFKVTEVFPGRIMLVKLTLCDRLTYIFSRKQPQRYLLTISTQEYKSVRKVNIRPIGDHSGSIKPIIEMHEIIEENPIPSSLVPGEQNKQDETEAVNDYHQDIYSLEATSTYMYHKIFVDKSYSLGMKMKRLLEEEDQRITELSSQNALLAIGGIREITDDMLKGFNCTRKELLEILCHCRQTVEDFYHDRKFKLPSREHLELERGSVEAEVLEGIPQTVKAFQKMLTEINSTSLIRALFMLNYVFDVECELAKYTSQEKHCLGRKLGHNFNSQLMQKSRLLNLWGYSSMNYQELLAPFT